MLQVRANPAASGLAPLLGVLTGGMVFAVLAGLGMAVMGTFAAALFASILLGISALFVPIRWLVVALLCTSFLIAGQLTYFARIDKALWFPFLIGALILVRYPLDRMQRGRHAAGQAAIEPRTPTALKVLIALYFATLLASSLVNTVPPLQVLVSSKEYVFLWGLYLVLAAGLVTPGMVSRIWTLLPWLMLVQLPLVVYQRFVVAASRINRGAAWDSVVGAFGGNPQGGGASGAMGMFCVVAIIIVVARWRKGLMPGWQALLLGLSGMLCIALAEIKFAVLLLPVGFGLLFLRQFTRNPFKGLLAVGVGFALAFVVLVGYKAQYARETKHETIAEYFESMFSSSTDTDFVNLRTREIGRFAAIKFWADKHGLDQPLYFFIGHGAGSSRVGELVVGEAAKPYPFNIARSALAVLLWETGLMGTFAFVAMLTVAWWRTFRQSRDPRLDADSQATVASMAVAIALLASGLPYNTDLLFSHQIELLLMLCLGHLAMTSGRLQARGGVPAWSPAATLLRSAR